MGTANSLHASANTASIMKGFVLEYLTRTRVSAEKFPEGAIEKKNKKKRAIAHQERLPLLAVED